MGKKESRIYLHAIICRYRRANRAVKGVILDEFCSVCGYNRKYAVRILNHPPSGSSKRHVGRKPVYRGNEFLTALKQIWFASDQMCSKKRHKKRCMTRPGTLLRNQIPIRTHHWDVTQPGFVEADIVAHCGNSIAGEFVWSLTFTDILTTWTENRATWGKGSIGVLDQIKDIENHIPFTLKGFNCDNGLPAESNIFTHKSPTTHFAAHWLHSPFCPHA